MSYFLNVYFLVSVLLSTSVSFAQDDGEQRVKFRFPIADEDRRLIRRFPIFGFDHDPRNRLAFSCRNYRGKRFPYCYDGHKGTDYMLRGGFRTMDKGSATIVAAQSGTVIRVQDGNYDRCRFSLIRLKVYCKGHPLKPNLVEIRHFDGSITRYLHFKKNSIVVREGDFVDCGQELGKVGSSGLSSAPHLHFALIDNSGLPADPYKGIRSQEYSFWRVQRTKDGLPSGKCN